MLQGEVGDFSCIESKLVSILKRQRSLSEQHFCVSDSVAELIPCCPLMQPPSGCGERLHLPTELGEGKVTLQNTPLIREKSLKAVEVWTRREHQL